VFREVPLLKVGMIMMALALALVIAAVVVSAAPRSDPERAVASGTKATKKPSVEPLIRGESPPQPWREKEKPLPTANVSKNESSYGPSGSEPKPGDTSTPVAEPRPEPEPHVQAEPEEQPEPKPRQQTLSAEESGWQRPTRQELEAANEPRHYNLPAGAIMGLTIEAIGIYNAPVFDSDSQWALANGVAHVPETSLPWSQSAKRNVFLAGHRMGYRGTWSRMIFYSLGRLGESDRIVLKDRTGRSYEYRVSETFLAKPSDSWVMGQVRGRDMVTLQTCTPFPTFEKRLIVRADRV
jgi:sortase A